MIEGGEVHLGFAAMILEIFQLSKETTGPTD